MASWDESKRLQNLAKHGLDFEDCERIFENPALSWEDDRESYGE